MPTRSHIRRRSAPGPSTGIATDTEGGRAFFQERLAIWAKVGFLITFGFFVLDQLSALLGMMPAGTATEHSLHLGVVVLWGGTWLALRRREFSRTTLGVVDATIVLVGCTLSALDALVDDPVNHYTYMPALIVFIGSVGRALFVPSTGRRTFLISAGIAVGVQGLAVRLAPAAEPTHFLNADSLRTFSLAFGVCAVLLATVASHVIYGLRQEIRKALQLGQYTLEEKLGEGGMGTVYRARHAMLRRPTAVKLLPPEKVGESSLERFEREVQLTAALSHPNTVAIFDYGRTPDGIFYYAMEYLDGIDLESLVMAHGPQPPARVVHVLRQVCGSLGEAHEAGLVHRDIKPANVILCERGGAPDVAKVVDFGLVKDLEDGHAITRTDAITGTPLYLAPEAVRGEEVDGRGDLYALGALGYYLLAGRNVFEGKTLVEICGHHLHAAPAPPSEALGRPLPPQLEAVILSCLEKDRARRPATARELAARLAECDGVPVWTEEDAREWWAERGAFPARAGEASGGLGSGTLVPSLERWSLAVPAKPERDG
jgi:serine/threonine-protein kinase